MRSRWTLLLLPAALVVAVIYACAPTANPRPADLAPLPCDRRIDVPYLPQLALPARALGLAPGTSAFRARLDDGRPVTGSVLRFAATPGTHAAVPPGAHPGWLPTLAGWTRVPLTGAPRPTDIEVALLDIPTDAAGQGLWINDDRVRLNWLPSSLTIATGVPWSRSSESPPTLDLRAAADAEATNPFRRWRARLALGTLADPDDGPRPDRFPDDALERLAQIAEERWRVALAALHADDPTLFERVRARLTLMINVGDGRLAPAWPVLQADLDALQADLLDPDSNTQRRRGRVSRWLDAQPVAVAWVSSDAVSLNASNAAPFARVLAANLSRSDLPASVQPLAAFEPPQLARVPASGIAAIDVPLPPLTDRPSPGAQPIALDATVGPWRSRLTAASGPIPASPPGVFLAPLLRDWSLTSWSAGQPDPLLNDSPVILMLREPSERPHTRRAIDGWALHVRIPAPPLEAPRSLHVWLGRQGAPEEVWRFEIDPASETARARRIKPGAEPGPPFPPTRDDSNALTWRVPVSPAAALAGFFPIAAVYTDHLGDRYAFPRAMMPWETEPGRVLIDPRRMGGCRRSRPLILPPRGFTRQQSRYNQPLGTPLGDRRTWSLPCPTPAGPIPPRAIPHPPHPPTAPTAPTPATTRPNHFIEDLVEADNAALKWGTWGPAEPDRANTPKVHTRFPPEPNGYLHIGHAKSILLNHSLAARFHGKFNLRFDDTNPAKEEREYVESITRDVRWLGADFESPPTGGGLFFASNYFEQMYAFAEELVLKGKAYVCELSAEEVAKRRGSPGVPATSPHRDRPADESLRLLREMRDGKHPDGAMTLRAKIDLASPNFNLRDPVLYRISHQHHHNTADRWCIYPMYDWAHGFEDSIEGITHSICTLEFENHRPLYDWFIDAVNEGRAPEKRIHHPQQIEFAKLRPTYTIMSKRNLLRMVESGVVKGWDDPRMPTLSGLRRRGVTPDAIRALCEDVGVTRVESSIDLVRLENAVRDHLNLAAPRRMAVLRPLRVVIENYPEGLTETFDCINNPEDPAAGSRPVPFSREIYIERDDFMESPPKGYFRLAPGQEVRLRWAYFIRATRFDTNPDGSVATVYATYDPATRGGDSPPNPDGTPGRKVKGTIHWVSAAHAVDAQVRLIDRLFTAEVPGERTGNFMDDLNPDSLTVLTGCKLEPSLAQARFGGNAENGCAVGDRFQFERLGYFCVDPDSTPGAPVFNRTVTLKDSWAKAAAKSAAR